VIINTEVLLWTQIASIIVFLGTLFGLYKVLIEQKDATIQLQKENIAYLKDQLADAKAKSPDLLAQTLASRIKLLEEELKRLVQDNSSTQEQVNAKETELKQAREIEKLIKETAEQVKRSPFSFIAVTKNIVGKIPLFITEFTLPAGVYTQTKGHFGVIPPLTDTDIAYLDIRTQDGTVLKTLSNSGVPSEITSTGFTLDADTVIGFCLYGSNNTTHSFIISLGVK